MDDDISDMQNRLQHLMDEEQCYTLILTKLNAMRERWKAPEHISISSDGESEEHIEVISLSDSEESEDVIVEESVEAEKGFDGLFSEPAFSPVETLASKDPESAYNESERVSDKKPPATEEEFKDVPDKRSRQMPDEGLDKKSESENESELSFSDNVEFEDLSDFESFDLEPMPANESEYVPDGSLLDESLPEGAVLDDSFLDDLAPSESVPDRPVRDESVLDDSVVNESVSDEKSGIHVPIISWTGLSKEQQDITRSVVRKLGGDAHADIQENTTHLVCGIDAEQRAERTAKYFSAILRRKIWIVSYDWLQDALNRGQWGPEEPFEIAVDKKGLSGAKKSRTSLPKHPTKKDMLFANCVFFISQKNLSTGNLNQIFQSALQHGGGTKAVSLRNLKTRVSEKKDDEVLIHITDRPQNPCGAQQVTVDWLLDSISTYELQPFKNYIPVIKS
eukprot:TRINITY_DN6086_c0_g1_i1.p1 TRINITY_DN6086_c0_g1~~TRINITY_DN6086_c0_g1_i1.p1  ORF type:complete len:459 (+),score=74.66 TRINITY_DN6086_c0_g1_i1:30-1379(+)